MCRNIKTLRNMDHHASEDEIREAALQFVRKVSGYRRPSKVNQPAFDSAVDQIAEATHKMLHALVVRESTMSTSNETHLSSHQPNRVLEKVGLGNPFAPGEE